MRYLSSYLSFQRLLLNEKLQYEIDIPKELSECEMPKLLIQPLVENAIKYGMDEQEGQLRVSLRQEGDLPGFLKSGTMEKGCRRRPPAACFRTIQEITADLGYVL